MLVQDQKECGSLSTDTQLIGAQSVTCDTHLTNIERYASTAGSKQKQCKIMKMQLLAILKRAKPDTEYIIV
jgi:hypothetical protein